MKVLRSLLLLRQIDFDTVEQVAACGADAVILDLTGSLGSEEADAIRLDVACSLAAGRGGEADAPLVFAQIDPLDTRQGERDLEAFASFGPAGIVLPGARTGADVQHLGARLAVIEAKNGLPDGSCAILPLVTQTAASLFGLGTYAGCSPRLMGLAWGADDVLAAVGAAPQMRSGSDVAMVCQLARTLTLVGARAAGVQPIDTAYAALADEAGLARECEMARCDGFTGKIALSVAQAQIINDVFGRSA